MVFACSNFVFVVVAAFRNSGSFRSIRATRDGGRRLLLFRRYMFRFSLFYFYSIFFTHTNMLTILLCVRELADLCAVFDKMENIAFASFLVDFFFKFGNNRAASGCRRVEALWWRGLVFDFSASWLYAHSMCGRVVWMKTKEYRTQNWNIIRRVTCMRTKNTARKNQMVYCANEECKLIWLYTFFSDCTIQQYSDAC